ncbi:MAG: TolC family protein [Phycisphaerales bacterium]
MTRRARQRSSLQFLVLVLLAGCHSYDGAKIRREHAAGYPGELRDKTTEVLAQRQALSLDDCIAIAMENNLDTRTAAIEKRIAKLERRIAFANFLPVVSLDYSQYEFDPDIALPLSDNQALRLDNAKALLWNTSVSVFNPATWFLYGMYTRGEEIADQVVLYTRQMTALQVTALYFQSLTLEQAERSLIADAEAAQALQVEVVALSEEGLVSGWQADQADVYARSRRAELARVRRVHKQTVSALMAAMGLAPLTEITLAGQTPLEPPQGTTEDLILEAMLNHPSLHIADRKIAIEKEKVKLAIANFLPVLGAFAYHPDTFDSSFVPSNQWAYGLAGTLTLFNGFANINEYKAARERREEAFIAREQTALTLMLEVIRAQQNLETAADQLDLAERSMAVSTRRYTERLEQWKEGLTGSADLLQEAAKQANTQMQVLAARFQHQVATATLLNVMGKTATDVKENEHEPQS